MSKSKKKLEDELRMYIVIRKDVGEIMSKPKFGVQCSHAILSCWINCLRKDPDRAWKYYGWKQPKVALEVKNQAALEALYEKALQAEFYASIITDSGRTEFAEPTMTAVAVGPVWYEAEAQKTFLKRTRLYTEKRVDKS